MSRNDQKCDKCGSKISGISGKCVNPWCSGTLKP